MWTSTLLKCPAQAPAIQLNPTRGETFNERLELIMGRLLLVRHGETPWNAEGRLQGSIDIGLSEKGRRQARMIGARLADTSIDVAYSSDQSRAHETAQHILEGRSVGLNPIPDLRERAHGVFEGLTVRERKDRYLEMFADSLVKNLDFAPTGGETFRGTNRRMAGWAPGFLQDHLKQTVLVVGHGGSLRAAIIAWMGFSDEATWRFILANCGLSIIDTYADNAVLRLFNDISHLDGLGPES